MEKEVIEYFKAYGCEGMKVRRDIKMLVCGQFFSRLGENVSNVALISLVYVSAPDYFGVSLLLLCMATAAMLAGICSGVFIDRVNKKYILLFCDGMRGVIILLFCLGASQGVMYFLAFLLSGLNSVFSSTMQAGVPEIAEERELLTINSLLETGESMAVIMGSVSGGLLVATQGAYAAFYFDSVTYLISFLTIIGCPFRTVLADVKDKGAIWTGYMVGFRYLNNSSITRYLLISFSFFVFAAGIVNTLSIAYAVQVLQQGVQGFGYLEGAWGGGMVLGGLFVMNLTRKISLGKLYAASMLAAGVAMLLIPIQSYLYTAVIYFCLIGFGNMTAYIISSTLLQKLTPRHVVGRVFAFRTVILRLVSLIAIGSAGDLIDRLGLERTLGLAGVILLAGCVMGWFSKSIKS